MGRKLQNIPGIGRGVWDVRFGALKFRAVSSLAAETDGAHGVFFFPAPVVAVYSRLVGSECVRVTAGSVLGLEG